MQHGQQIKIKQEPAKSLRKNYIKEQPAKHKQKIQIFA